MAVKYKKLKHHTEAERFYSLFYKEPSALLDSSLQNQYGRYSIAGRYPYLTVEEYGGRLRVNGKERQESLLDFLAEHMKKHLEENPTELPMIAGAVGYLTYDYGREMELPPSQNRQGPDMPEGLFRFYDLYIIEDLEKKETWVCTEEKLHDLAWYIRETEKLERQLETQGQQRREEPCQGQNTELVADRTEVCSDFGREEYLRAIDEMIGHIRAGDIYIANMTRQIRVLAETEPYQVFRRLRKQNPSPFGAYLGGDDFSVVCASPERFLEVRGRQAETRPIKGTRPRGGTPEEDRRLRKELEQSDKDRSELLMIVDLERNDLNRVCRPGSVRVTELFAVEEYATVFHLVSTVHGMLQEGYSVSDLLRAAFPGGSITGAPKIRAMEIIEDLEKSRRGLYTGTIGYLSLDGDCDLNIVIRTAVHQDGVWYLGAGGGITCESEPDFEYEETWQKAKAVVAAIAGITTEEAEKIWNG